MQQLISWDHQLFHLINNGLANPFFDYIMPWLRNTEFWAPLYIFFLAFSIINFKKKAWLWILFFIATATLTDTVSSKIIKEHIWRTRPFDTPGVAEWARVLVNRPGNSSFTSSHAANHFGAAAFIVFTVKAVWGRWVYLFYAWAAIICFAQVYVGVHFPIDIFCGGLTGFFIGFAIAKAFNKISGLADVMAAGRQPA